MDCHSLLQDIFLIQALNPGLLNCRENACHMSYQHGSITVRYYFYVAVLDHTRHPRNIINILYVQFSCSVVSDSLQPHGPQHTRLPCPLPSLRVYSNSCPIESVMPSSHLILCRPHLLLPSIFPSIRVFSNELALHIRWPKYCSFSFSLFSEYSGKVVVFSANPKDASSH